MAGTDILKALNETELENIHKDVQEKLNAYLQTKSEETNSLKSKYEKLRVNSEQQYFEIEKQLITTSGKLETETVQKITLQEKYAHLETKFADISKQLQELQESRETFSTSEYEYKSTIQILENEKRDLSNISSKRNKEIDRLNEEIKELHQKISTANNEKCEAQAKLNELQSEEVTREYREKRLEKEKEQLEKQVEWFNNQLTEKTNQLSSVRKEKTSHVLEIQASLDDKTQELEHLQAVVEQLKSSMEEHNKRIDSLNEKLKDEREGQVVLDEQFRQELAVQKRLTELYKSSAEENDEKITELTGAVEELRRLLKEAAKGYTDLESTMVEETNNLTADSRDKAETVSKLEKELQSANELLVAMKKGAITLTEDAVEALSPAAAATSKLLKTGMTLTQIYNEYVQATDALNEEKEENKRLSSYLNQIVQEIEEKAPFLKKQREDYETALTNLDQMTSQLDTAMLECEKLRTDNEDMRRRYGHVERECEKQNQTSQDLSRQVQHLLKEVEELRGGRIVRDDLNVSSSEVSSSSNVISEKLVTFRTIKELQQQNQRLIEVARDLSEKKEAEETEATAEKTRELKQQLEFAMSELENMKDTRNRQAEMVESIVRQRDMYRVLLQQGGSSPEMSALTPGPVTSTPAHPTPKARTPQASPQVDTASKKEAEAARNALKELREEFDAYKKEKAENEKLQNEMSEKLRKNASDLRVSNTKLATQVEFATERYKILQNNAAGYKKEIDLLQERSNKSSATILGHETALAHLKEDLMGAQENIARWQNQVDNLKAERELLKNSERKFCMEMESMRREQSSQSVLMASLEAIKNNQERAEFEAKTRHTNQVEMLEKDIAHLRRKLEGLLEEKAKQATQWEDIVKKVHLEIAHEKEKQASLQTKADLAVAEAQTSKQELSTCESKLVAAEKKLENLAKQTEKDPDSESIESKLETEAIKDLKNQMAQQQIFVKSLQQQLEAAKKHANQYKTIADGVEQSLKDQSQTSKEVQAECEKKIHEAMAEKNELAKRIELLEKDLEDANNENIRLTNESQSLHGDLKKQVAKLQTELEESMSQRDAAVANSEAAQEDCKQQADIAAKAQDKYQRELMLHSADVEALQAVRKQCEEVNEFLQQSQEETTLYEKQLTDAKTSWAEQERIFKTDAKMLESRCEELTKQNDSLHEQMSKLSDQVVSIQQSSKRESFGANTSFSEETGKTSEQLLEVIKFLRREKTIAETKLKAVETECGRVKQQLAHVEKMSEEAQKALSEERQRSQVNAETVANQVELMRKVSSLNVLTDSNKLLRDERDQLLNSKQEMESKIAKLESDIEPLQAKLRDLECSKETLTVEKNTLQDELNRWKTRSTKLIEESHKTDPEEHKRLIQDKETLGRQLRQLKEENFKFKNDLNRANTTITTLSTEVTNLKQEAAKTEQELGNLKKQVEDKTKEAEELNKTINKLKQIGRKYKEQAEKVSKELDDFKIKAAGQESTKVNVSSLEQTIAELRRTITTNSSQISSLENQLTEAQNEGQAAVKRAEQAVAENNTLKAASFKRTEQVVAETNALKAENNTFKENLAKTQQELTKAQETNTRLKSEVENFETRAAEFEKKQVQSKQVLQGARSKMVNQKAEMERLEVENRELKASLSDLQGASGQDDSEQVRVLKAQSEARGNRLQGELDEARKSVQTQMQLVEKLQGDNAELHTKILQLQRQLEAAQHKPSSSQQSMSTRAGPSTSSDAPKTANIKPMAPAASTSRQSAPITSHSPAAVKATASIKPMAISPTTTSITSGTPTATVMPTTVSQADTSSDDNLPGPSGLQQTSSSIPSASVSGRVQIVEPQVAGDWNQEHSGVSDQGPEESATNQAVVTPSIQETVRVVNPTQSGSSHVSTSDNAPHTTAVALKRFRDDESFGQDESDSKRSRMASQEHAIPTIQVIDENQQVVTQIQPQSAVTGQPQGQVQPQTRQGLPTASAAPSVTVSIASVTPSAKMPEPQRTGDDVIMVLSDEDDGQNRDNDEIEEDDEDEEDYEDDEDEEDEDEEDIEEEVEDGDDVVIIDMDEHQQQQQSSVPPPLQPIPQGEGMQSAGRSQQLTPFMMAGPGNLFEDDDCTVPSTPTLSQPRRADGFAEALNSPAVAQRFVFGSNADLAELESQRALGMDDTRMDLSQFDATGRSAPSTPTPQTASAVAVASEEEAGGDNFPATLESLEPSSPTAGDNQRKTDDIDVDDDGLDEFEGDHDEEEDVDDADTADSHDTGASALKDDTENSQDKTETSAKPPIKKIVWDHSAGSSSQGATPIAPVVAGVTPMQQTTQPIQQQRTAQRRAQGLRRGLPSRGRGSQNWSQGQSRGSQRGRGWRGGFRGV